MSSNPLPLIIEPDALQAQLGQTNVLIADLCKPEVYARTHLPGAVHLDYMQVIAAFNPGMGLLPGETQLSELFSSIGMTPGTHVVAYDDEGGGRAARLLWTLEMIGHRSYALLNGGIHAWAAENRPLTAEAAAPPRSRYPVTIQGEAGADKPYILEHLNDPGVVLLDCRSPAEYAGRKSFARRAGHIPGAVNFEWTNAIDPQRALRLRPAQEIGPALRGLGVSPEKEVITYCQTHHRSAHTYIVLKSLGYEKIKGYAGSWSEWGNDLETPVEQ